MIFGVNTESGKIFATLPRGDQTDQFRCVPSICGNPTCTCQSVELTFVDPELESVSSKGADSLDKPKQPRTSIDLQTNRMTAEFRRTASKDDIEFGELLIAKMGPDDFNLLGQLFYTYKNRYTEEATPDTIDPHFDFDEIETLKHVADIAAAQRRGDRLALTIDGATYIILDQHCVRTGCDCTEGYMEILPLLPEGNLGKPAGTVLLDHAKRQWKAPPEDKAPSDLSAWQQRIESAIPNFYETIESRHLRLQAIYSHCRKRYMAHHPAARKKANISTSPKIGRNDPCPCGIGKKYKKCCGAIA